MARSVLLMRHGKSDWDAAFEADADRPLAPRGRDAARRMGRALTALRFVPDRILCSPALRTRQTTAIVKETGEWICDVDVEAALYEGGAEGVLQVIRRQADNEGRILVVGHEPTSSDVLASLIGGGAHRLPTAAVASIDLPIDRWADVRSGQGLLRWLLTPKLLARIEKKG